MAQPLPEANPLIEGIDRATEDNLDWAENHARVGRGASRIGTTLIGIAVTLTAITIVAMAFIGF